MDKQLNQIVWLAMAGVLFYLVYNFNAPKFTQTKIVTKKNTEFTVRADRSGHYVFWGEINGRSVKFLYDTGATTVAIPEALASRMKLKKGRKYTTFTANGNSVAYMTILDKVRVGDIVLTNVIGSISPGFKGDQVLLGMSFLRHLETSQYKGKLTLRVRDK